MSAKLGVVIRILVLAGCWELCSEDTFAAESRVIYRCEEQGVPTFSDHPCGGATEVHESSEFVTNTYEGSRARVPPRSRDAAPPKAKARKTTVHPARREDSCDRIARSLKDIRSRMRAGYAAAEGERLRERRAKLRALQRQGRCS